MGQYNVSLSDVFSSTFAEYIYTYVQAIYDTAALAMAECLTELLEIRDGLLVLPSNNLSLTVGELRNIVDFVCTK